MKTVFATLMVLFSASTTFAFNFKQNAPSLVCHDTSIRIPEHSFQLEVFGRSQSKQDVTVKFQFIDLNAGAEVLFEGPVVESFDKATSSFDGNGLNLSLAANQAGEISGQVTLAQEGSLITVPVACQKLYQIMEPISYK